MIKKLKDISNLILGFTFRGAIIPDKNGNTFVFQAKNVATGNKIIDLRSLTMISFKNFHGSYFLRKNDIALTLRGANIGSFRAAVIQGNSENVLASSSVIVARLTGYEVLPEYLSIYLNSKEGQKKILKSVTGSYIHSISRNKLSEIEIPIPSIDMQETIVKLSDNLRYQREICERKIQIKKNIANAIFEKLT